MNVSQRVKFLRKLHNPVNGVQYAPLFGTSNVRSHLEQHCPFFKFYVILTDNSRTDLNLAKSKNPNSNYFAVQNGKLQSGTAPKEYLFKNHKKLCILNWFGPNFCELERQQLRELYRGSHNNLRTQIQKIKVSGKRTKSRGTFSIEREETKDSKNGSCLSETSKAIITGVARNALESEAKNVVTTITREISDQRKMPYAVAMNQLDVSGSDDRTRRRFQRRRLIGDQNLTTDAFTLQLQYCAHCRQTINDVVFISGTQQLCSDCADRHYHSYRNKIRRPQTRL